MKEREMPMPNEIKLEIETLDHINEALEQCDIDESCNLDKVETHLGGHGFDNGFFNRHRL